MWETSSRQVQSEDLQAVYLDSSGANAGTLRGVIVRQMQATSQMSPSFRQASYGTSCIRSRVLAGSRITCWQRYDIGMELSLLSYMTGSNTVISDRQYDTLNLAPSKHDVTRHDVTG